MRRLMQWIIQSVNRCLLVALVIYGLVGAAFVWCVFHYPDLPPEQKADGVVILTGGAERVDTGFGYIQAGKAPRVLVSGVHKDVTIADLLRLHHAPKSLADKIDLGFGAIDTAGNAQETAKWVKTQDAKTLIIVTSNYHMPRAILHLRAILPRGVKLYPSSVTPDMLQKPDWYKHQQAWSLLFLAYNKYLLTWPEILLWRYKK